MSLFISVNWPGLVTYKVQKIYSKMHPVFSTNTHRDVINLVNHGMAKIQKLKYLEKDQFKGRSSKLFVTEPNIKEL